MNREGHIHTAYHYAGTSVESLTNTIEELKLSLGDNDPIIKLLETFKHTAELTLKPLEKAGVNHSVEHPVHHSNGTEKQ